MQSLQSTWYLFPGQTMENTRITDRGKALVATPEGWTHLTQHLDRNANQEKILADELARKKYLKDGSYNMTKNWENSLEKIRARRLAEHANKIKAIKEERMARFMEITAVHEKDRQKYVKDVKKRLFMLEEKSRHLNSALWTSEVMYERNRQDEFNERQREHEAIELAKYAKQILQNAEDERLENIEKKRKTRARNVAHADYLMSQVNAKLEKEKAVNDATMRHEAIDNVMAAKEYEANKKHEEEKDRTQKNENRQIVLDFQKQRDLIKQEERRHDLAHDKTIEVYTRAKCRIDLKTKDKLKQMAAEKQVLRDNAARLMVASLVGVEERRNELLQDARQELEERADKREQDEASYKKKLREERIEDRKRYVAAQEQKAALKNENDTFILLTRLKNSECNDQHQIVRKEKGKQKMSDYSKELKDQIADVESKKNREKREAEEDLKHGQKMIEKLDSKFFAYGEEVFNLAKDRGRPTLPIEAVIEKYKIENGLKPKKKNRSNLKSNVPINAKTSEESCQCK